jgi:hypothetical protein
MDEVVVRAADARDVVDVGGAAVLPGLEVMGVAPIQRAVAAGEDAAAVEDLARLVEPHGQDAGLARQTPRDGRGEGGAVSETGLGMLGELAEEGLVVDEHDHGRGRRGSRADVEPLGAPAQLDECVGPARATGR